ncbi:MAG: DMT family transporter [Lachnospiraceae bacterium]|uniref:DMT family transporter n=1 Tax=Candidatus Weimeria bifida TaxID=2599074 RepID=A0A6N7IXL9_9FIRM|nr:DMT family transporter [Candidatus Weimeria bifida]RRF96638.1 MAG: DMT family transporter [Lachnospiraceae bacterium]
MNDRIEKKNNPLSALLLLVAAALWGFTFAFQDMGADHIDAGSFLAMRSWTACVFLFFVIKIADKIKISKGIPTGQPTTHTMRRHYLTGGLICGASLFFASFFQQAGLAYTTTAKASFITALYVIIVPITCVFRKQFPKAHVWFAVGLGVIGLYLLSFSKGPDGINPGDMIIMISALLWTVQILCVDYFKYAIDGIRLSFYQTLTQGLIATAVMLVKGLPAMENVMAALPAILFAGIFSSGIAFTLQIIAQGGLDPTSASLIMCLESVFGAIGGFLFQGQTLTGRELAGCAIMFAGIVISQLPGREKTK